MYLKLNKSPDYDSNCEVKISSTKNFGNSSFVKTQFIWIQILLISSIN